jgi:hypothetical protein
MQTHIKYSDIPVEERKRLSAIAFQKPLVFASFFVATTIPTLFVNIFGRHYIPGGVSLLVRFGMIFGMVGLGTALILMVLTLPLLRSEIEKLKNA